jgi:hypothetical protein
VVVEVRRPGELAFGCESGRRCRVSKIHMVGVWIVEDLTFDLPRPHPSTFCT